MKKLSINSFMNEKKTGLILRGYAIRPEDITPRVAMFDKLVTQARKSQVAKKQFIGRIDIVIWANNSDYPGQCDCGGLKAALNDHFKGDRNVFVHELLEGDPFCFALNWAVAKQLRAGCDYSIIASTEANEYWSSDVPEKMVMAACDDARNIGIAINGLTDSIMEGRILNTMAMWHNMSLISVGGFDMRAAKPFDDRLAHYVKGIDQHGDVRFYHVGGVEEIIPQARLVDEFGQCLAPIQSDNPELRYILPDAKEDPELYDHHMHKFGTKFERQIAHALHINRDLSHIKGGVMNGYGWRS